MGRVGDEQALGGQTLTRWTVGVFMALSVVACGWGGPEHVYRYRLTLGVEADGKVYTGSSVVEVGLTAPEAPFHMRTRVRGEATAVELGRGRVLVALLEGVSGSSVPLNDGTRWVEYGPTQILSRNYGIESGWDGPRSPGLVALAEQRGAHALTREQLPYLVGFTDGRDLRSFGVISPSDLSPLGEDVRLLSATLEVTDDPVTRGIQRVLPWLKGRRGYLHGHDTCQTRRDLSNGRPFCPAAFQFRRGS